MSKKDFEFIIEKESNSDVMESKGQIIPIIGDTDEESAASLTIPDIVPILALRGSVLFPEALSPITIGREKSIRLVRDVEKRGGILGTVLQKDSNIQDPAPEDMYRVGTAAKILKVLEMPNGGLTVILQGISKFEVKEYLATEPYFRAAVLPLKDSFPKENSEEFKAILSSIKDTMLRVAKSSQNLAPEVTFALKNISSNRALVNFVISNIDLPDSDRQMLLETGDLLERAKKLLEILLNHAAKAELKKEIESKVREDMDEQQRRYIMSQEIKEMQRRLNDGDEDEYEKLRSRAKDKKWPDHVKKAFEEELTRFERTSTQTAEYTIQLTYLQTLLDLPWQDFTEDNMDLKGAKEQLDKDHYALDDVKDRIIEYLAVLKLKGDLKSPILCLYGAPGVGKTSLGKSVADALGRKFGRISLGGMSDEAEIRGHRRTYIGAMPGRIIQTIKRAGTSNPVIILDEIDKVNDGGFHGDPASALLEVLDPDQNTTFHDNYLDLEYDLSHVLFIATANNVSKIPPALRDRMEMINVPGYLLEEKVEISKRHLLSKQLDAHGLNGDQLKISPKMFEKIISEYTREGGVRTLDKLIAKIARNRAKSVGMEESYRPDITEKDVEKILGVPRYRNDKQEEKGEIGVVTGLAWTEVGGEILFIESSLSHGKGGLVITGNLGDVMKESASIALGWVKSHADDLHIDPKLFEEYDIHIHVPEGAVPKDGPSAGITMVTSLVSTYTKQPVKAHIAMTGETTLRGKVLPVGGLQEKILAAKRSGVTDIIVCEENRKDIEDIKKQYVKGLTFHYVRTLDDVLALAI